MQLHLGDVGVYVRKVQAALALDPQGTFDGALEAAVKAYQIANGKADTGVVDEWVWQSLLLPVPAASPLTVLDVPGAVSLFDLQQGVGQALLAANNLSDLANTAAARTNLGLGSAAVEDASAFDAAGSAAAAQAAAIAAAATDATTKANAAQAAAIAASDPVGSAAAAQAAAIAAAATDATTKANAAQAAAIAAAATDATTKANAAQAAAIAACIAASALDTDGTLAANSDTRVASQKATKTYADGKIPKSAFTAADKLLYSTAASTYAETGITSASRGILADSTAWAWDATNKVITIGPNTSPTGLILRTPNSPVPDPVNDGATFILSGQTYPFMYWKNTHASANKGMILGLNDTEGYFAVRDNWPLKVYTNNILRLTISAAGVATFATGVEVSDLTVNEGVYAAASGRLTRTRRLQIYATGTTNGTAGTSVSLTAAALGTSGDLRLIRLTVKAKGSNVPPAKYARSLECFWGNAAGTLTQTGTDTLGTLYSSGNLAGATIVSAASGTNVVVTCTDVTGVGATVTWELFGEYM